MVAAMDPTPASAPSGWYPDPWGNPGMRYWDGARWTPHYAAPASRPWTAGRVLALVFGVFFALAALAGFITAARALRDVSTTVDLVVVVLDLVIPTVLAIVGRGMIARALRREPK
jgi:hypothetical protein